MSHCYTVFFLRFLILTVVFFSNNIQAKTQTQSTLTQNKQLPSDKITIQYNKGLIDATLIKAPIGNVLKELEAKTGARVVVCDPSILDVRLSLSLTKIPLEKSIPILLTGFSYAFFRSKDVYVIIVLSTEPKVNDSSRVFHYHANSAAQPETFIDTTKKTNGKNPIPKSLDEFQAISLANPDINFNNDQYNQENEHLTIEQQHQEFIIQRALDIINSEHKHLVNLAFSQLIGINDSLVTEILIDATEIETDWLSRTQAVDLLWQHAVNLQFADTATLNALKQLTTDSDENISRVALEAVQESDQYQQNH